MEGLPCTPMQQLNRKSLECVPVGNGSTNGVLELLIADSTHSEATLRLVGREGGA